MARTKKAGPTKKGMASSVDAQLLAGQASELEGEPSVHPGLDAGAALPTDEIESIQPSKAQAKAKAKGQKKAVAVAPHNQDEDGEDDNDGGGHAESASDSADGDGDSSSGEDGSEGEEEDEEDEDDVLDAFDEKVAGAVEDLGEVVGEPAQFLQANKRVSDLVRAASKALFDYGAGAAPSKNAQALQELYVEGMDPEQIWLQLELQAEPLLKHTRRLMRKIGPNPTLLTPEMDAALAEMLEAGSSEEEGSDLDDEGEEEEEEDGSEDEALLDAAQAGAADYDSDDYEALLAGKAPKGSKGAGKGINGAGPGARKRGRQPLEDGFMSLEAMERFVAQAERGNAAADAADGSDEGDEDGEGGSGEDSDAGEGDDVDVVAALERMARIRGQKRKEKQAGRGGGGSSGSEEEFDLEGGSLDGGEGSSGEEDGDEDADVDADEDADEDEGPARKKMKSVRFEDGEEEDEMMYEDYFEKGDEFNFEDEEEEEGGLGEGRELMRGSEGEEDDRDLGPSGMDLGGVGGPATAHEKRMARMAEKVKRLEEEALGEKDWFLRGEAAARSRPVNSALEVDLDFETSARAAPQPTVEATTGLEELIKKRIADGIFNDPIRIAPAPPEKKRVQIELDDKKSSKGLGEIYADEFVAVASGIPKEDKDEKLRGEARALLKTLFAKLDSLSHFHYAPKPIVEDMTVRANVPALAMEEVAPQIVSEASMRAPEEVFRREKRGLTVADTELGREDRSRVRAQKKRVRRTHTAQTDAEKKARAVTAGGDAPLAGRKSEAAEAAAAPKSKKKRKAAAEKPSTDVSSRGMYSKSAQVFAKLQEQRDAAAAGVKPGLKKTLEKTTRTASLLKL